MASRLGFCFWFSLFLLGFACDSPPPSGPVPLQPVEGQVLLDGKPAPDVMVAFHADKSDPAAKARDGGATSVPQPTGKTDSDGKFKLHTYVGDDGAPVGEYRVSFSFAGSAENRNLMAKATTRTLAIPLPLRYADPTLSKVTATVKAGANQLDPFQLKSAGSK